LRVYLEWEGGNQGPEGVETEEMIIMRRGRFRRGVYGEEGGNIGTGETE